MIPYRRYLALASFALVAGCSTTGEYPSLAQRPAERVEGSFEPEGSQVQMPAPTPPSADLTARLAELRRQAVAAHEEFNRATPAAQRLAANAGPTGSDSWAAAQVALADLDSIRSRAAIVLADLDSLWVEATVEVGPREAIGSVRSTVQSLIAEEDTVLARLRGRV